MLTHGRRLAAVAVLGVIGGWWATELAAQRPAAPGGSGPLWISESRLDETRRLLVVIDEVGRHAALRRSFRPPGRPRRGRALSPGLRAADRR